MTRLLPTKWFRLAPILLVALIAVLSVWPRPAGASPCKPDGQACRTNQSCCGTNGHNGLCVNSNPPGKRPAGACCTPTTCEAAGAQCGSIANGTCLTLAPLNCGTCPDDEICTAAHVCETTTTTTTTTSTSTTTLCAPTTCTDSNCGQTPDGCGGMIECPCNTCTITCVNGFTTTFACVLARTSCVPICPFECRDTCEALGSSCSTSLCALCSQ